MDDALLPRAELSQLGRAVDAALTRGVTDGLVIVGFGEVTSVIAWPPEQPRWVVKLLPPFASAEQLAAYTGVVESYLDRLAAAGVASVPTRVVEIGVAGAVRPRGLRAVMAQPLCRPESLLSRVLRESDGTAATPLLGQLVDTVVGAVDERVGLDAQVSNWVVSADDRLTYLDVSTPFMRNPSGEDVLDRALVCSVYPAVLRPALARWVVPRLASGYHDVEHVLLDIAANLHREGLERHVDLLLELAAGQGVRLDPNAVRRQHRLDRATWRALGALKSLDRTWQRSVRRRPYPFLLPQQTDD